MVNHDNLEDSASIGVAAVVLIFVTIMNVSIIVKYQKNLVYPEGQQKLVLIFLMPLFIGWSAWAELFKEGPLRILDFLMNLFKAICIAAFMVYIEKMFGWVKHGTENKYDEDVKNQILISTTVKKFNCLKIQPKTTVEEVKSFLKRTKILVFQQCVILIILGITGLVMVTSTDNLDFENSTQNTIFTLFSAIESISSVVSLVSLLALIVYVKDIKKFAHFQFLHKFIIIKLGLLFTELQPIVIEIFASAGLITNTSDYSTSQITTYTNALLTVSEMVVLSFLISEVYPISDYQVHPDDRLEIENKGGNKATLINT